MNFEAIFKILVAVCTLASGALGMWVCRILKLENTLTRQEMNIFYSFLLCYLVIASGCFVYFEFCL